MSATTAPSATPTLSDRPPYTLRPRHIVEKIDGRPAPACLCGYLWDVYPIRYDPEAGICAECVAEMRRREGMSS